MTVIKHIKSMHADMVIKAMDKLLSSPAIAISSTDGLPSSIYKVYRTITVYSVSSSWTKINFFCFCSFLHAPHSQCYVTFIGYFGKLGLLNKCGANTTDNASERAPAMA